MKVLIVHREFNEVGGIGSLYTALRKQFNFAADHFEVGSRSDETTRLKQFIRLFNDYVRFFSVIQKKRYDIIHINPTLDFKSTVRDGIYILLARSFCKKLIVHFHGWFPWFEKKIIGKRLWLFKRIYGKSDHFFVLSNQVKTKLKAWGFEQPISLLPNAVDIDLIKQLDFITLLDKRIAAPRPTVLFLSRIDRGKGIFETIEAIILARKSLPDIRLLVGGDGNDLEAMKYSARGMNSDTVTFLGYVKKDKKVTAFTDASIYLLPSYTEGMPITVLEAMAFGLPVIVTAVGGIPDFFENGKHGYMIQKADPEEIAKAITMLLSDKQLYISIARYNYRYAQEHFLSTTLAKTLETLYKQILKKT